jgi:hypothetical protein
MNVKEVADAMASPMSIYEHREKQNSGYNSDEEVPVICKKIHSTLVKFQSGEELVAKCLPHPSCHRARLANASLYVQINIGNLCLTVPQAEHLHNVT